MKSKQTCLLNYCAFITDIEKVPNKALHTLYRHRNHLHNFNNKLCAKLLNKKCKEILNKTLKRVGSLQRDFAEVIEHEIASKNLEIRVKHLIYSYIDYLLKLQNYRAEDADNSSFILRKGYILCQELIQIKGILFGLLNQNPENLRLLQIALKLSVRNYQKLKMF